MIAAYRRLYASAMGARRSDLNSGQMTAAES